MSDKRDKPEDLRDSGDRRAGDKVAGETLDGREKQSDDYKQYMSELKAGKKSGVTADFGKPVFEDSQAHKPSANLQTADHRDGDGKLQLASVSGRAGEVPQHKTDAQGRDVYETKDWRLTRLGDGKLRHEYKDRDGGAFEKTSEPDRMCRFETKGGKGTYDIGYDQNGKINKVTDHTNGKVHATGNGTDWSTTNTKTGEKTEIKDPQFMVDQNGVSWMGPDGKRIHHNRDGHHYRDKDAGGNIQERVDSNEQTVGLVPKKVEPPQRTDGASDTSRTGPQDARRSGPPLKPGETEQFESDGSRKITRPDGSNLIIEKNGRTTDTDKHGDKVITNTDKSKVYIDKDPDTKREQITKTVDARGRATEFDYDKKTGQLNWIKFPDGNIMSTEDGKTWNKNVGTKDFEATQFKLDPKLDKDGNLSYNHFAKSGNGYDRVTVKLDGTAEQRNTSGKLLMSRDADLNWHQHDSQGRKTRAFTSDGREYFSTDNGKSWQVPPRPDQIQNKKTNADGSVSYWDKAGNRFEERADGTFEASRLIDRRHGVSDQFVKKIEDTLDALPKNDRDIFTKAGYKVAAVAKVTDVVPEWANLRPGGYPRGKTYEHVSGIVLDNRKLAVIAETRKEGASFVPAANRESVLRHEFGHALDNALKGASKSEEFKNAYAADVARLPRQDRRPLSYQLQPGDAGRSEAFADIYASINGGPAIPGHKQLIERNFPNSTRALRNILARR